MPFMDQKAALLFRGHDSDSESFMKQREMSGGCQGDRKSHTGGYKDDWSNGDTHGERIGYSKMVTFVMMYIHIYLFT